MSNIKEDEGGSPIPANNAGGAGVEGIGVGPKGEPGIKRKTKVMPLKRFIATNAGKK